ncbi:MAG: hypothetical protein JWM11_385 [Planctomycetaceae bacterium]|nr:hypothetical protein [Planctomycetaceae bacterium]
MPQSAREAFVPFLDQAGRQLGLLRLVESGTTAHTILILTEDEARQAGEESVQLLEGFVYDYALVDAQGPWRVSSSGLVKPNVIQRGLGRIDTSVETGLFEILLENEFTQEPVARASVEIRSHKIDYRTDYRGMLGAIADQCAELLYDVRATAKMRLTPKSQLDPENLQRRLEFLSATIQSREFFAALHQITSAPHQVLRHAVESTPVGRIRRGGRDISRQLASGSCRQKLPADHPLSIRMVAAGIATPSVPSNVQVAVRFDSLDTPENRFVKYVVETFREFLGRARAQLGRSTSLASKRLERNIGYLAGKLNEVLTQSFFREISAPTCIPLGSPVLQRKAGYRELLLTWLKFELAADLAWQGGSEVYGAGKRDTSALYEYWVFFQLLRLFRDKFELDVSLGSSLFEVTDAGLNLKLKVHSPLGIEGRCVRQSRRLHVRYHYNLTYKQTEDRGTAGSWTRRMRPDFTLSFWPEGFSIEDAEMQELAVHIHFDAKYRVDNIAELFGLADDDMSNEKSEQKRGSYQRGDLLKMHAYRDAIKRSEGAYIIYPGKTTDPTHFQGFHEILPGLGAFSLRPGTDGQGVGLQHLSRFIDDTIAHVCNRATAREQSNYHLFQVYQSGISSNDNKLTSQIPEMDESVGMRAQPPTEQTVLVGWFDDEEHEAWIRRAGLYNFRAGDRSGSIRLAPEIAQADYLLLHTHGNRASSGLYRILKRGPRLFTNQELRKRGYPRESTTDAIYAVFDVAPEKFYSEWKWDYSKLSGRKTGRQSAEPFAVRLLDVLAIHDKR